MTDRELLELAAKAAGNGAEWYASLGMGVETGGVVPRLWNPLDNDADALRLAVKLDLEIYQGVNNELSCAHAGYAVLNRILYCIEVHEGSGKEAATRRAIVRAAAEIGRAMP